MGTAQASVGALVFAESQDAMLVAPGVDPLLMYVYVLVLDGKGLLANHAAESKMKMGCFG